MKIRDKIFNTLFLSGLVVGVLLTVCFIEGMEFGESLALEEKAQESSVKQAVVK